MMNIIDHIKLPFRREKALYLDLYKILGFLPHDIALYKLALMHKSVARRTAKGRPANNERLEFLGDAVLDATVGHIVYEHFPGKHEGFLTDTRSKLVKRETLGCLAREMGITRLILSSGRSASHNSYMGGNAFEALVGALYLDHGYDACMRFIQKQILAKLVNIDKMAYKEMNFKSKLIEWSQKNAVRMDYRLVSQEKDDEGSPQFEYLCTLEGIETGRGRGFSKKEAQQHAAEETLRRLRKQPKFCDSIFAAKTERTKMEEEPVMTVPDTEQKDDFLVVSETEAAAGGEATSAHDDTASCARRTGATDGDTQEACADVCETETVTAGETDAAAPVVTGGAGIPACETAEKDTPVEDTPVENTPAHGETPQPDEFDFSDIVAEKPEPTREDIIAAAEAAAFAEAEKEANKEAGTV